MPRYFVHRREDNDELWLTTISADRPVPNRVYVKRLRLYEPCEKDYDISHTDVYLDGVKVRNVISFDPEAGWIWVLKERWHEEAQCLSPYIDLETLEPAKERLTGAVTFEWVRR